MLEVGRLTRRYGSFVAVEDVSFNIGRGEIVGLLGHNGAGKTTIMKMVSGYLEPDRGTITVGGLDLAAHTKQVQKWLGYLPENLPIYPDMVVADYLEFAAGLKGLCGDRMREEITRVVAATDIGARLLSPIATLSRGFKQRVGVAQAILGSPRLLIMDEPTNGLDPTQTEHMRQLIRELAQDATVILSTHIMQEVDAVCDRVLILSAGRLAVDARLEQLRLSNRALLSCSLPPERALPLLGSLEGVGEVTPAAGSGGAAPGDYRLKFTEGAGHRAVCSRVASAVLAEAAELYSLQIEQRDLETLFREVSSAPHSTLAAAGREEGSIDDAA
jgi:ABC-2 type transport system ATP-binding protein